MDVSVHLSHAPQAREKIVTVNLEDTVTTAAKRMTENGIGCLIIADEQHKLVGIVSERDIIKHVVGAADASIDPLKTLVRDIMTTNVGTCSPGMSIDTAQKIMTDMSSSTIIS